MLTSLKEYQFPEESVIQMFIQCGMCTPLFAERKNTHHVRLEQKGLTLENKSENKRNTNHILLKSMTYTLGRQVGLFIFGKR